MAVEQRCTDLGANCIGSEPLNTNNYAFQFPWCNPADTTTSDKQLSMDSSGVGKVIENSSGVDMGSNWSYPSSGALFDALPNVSSSVNFVLQGTPEPSSIGLLGHVFSSSNPTARRSMRWYQYFSPTWELTGGACLNRGKIFELGQSPGLMVFTSDGDHQIYGFADSSGFNISPYDCCSGGPGSQSFSMSPATMNGKWWRFELVVRNALPTGGVTIVELWRTNVTDEGSTIKVIDTADTAFGPGTNGDNWTSAQATTLKFDERVDNFFITPWGNGTCTGFVGYSHILAAAWDTDAGQMIGAAEEIEGGGEPDTTPPTLSSPDDGTPLEDGCAGASVSTDEANGTLYWAVVTNGGSCTAAQLKAGTGGNIVAGSAGNQAVSSTGTQVIADISGLTASTLYQIKFLHSDAVGNDSTQASVNLTTAAEANEPTLSSASDGTPTTGGCTGAGVSTDQGDGTLYWAVVTNGGSCTDAQLKAGSGGNIVLGKAGNQAVSGTGVQTIPNITGLDSNTSYDIKYLHRNAGAEDSAQASADLATTWPGTQTIYWTESFPNTSFAARGWYGVSGAGAGIDSGRGHWTWDIGDGTSNEGYPSNRLLDSNATPTMTVTSPTIYMSFDLEVGANWGNGDLPHLLGFMTNGETIADPINGLNEWDGPSLATLYASFQTMGLKSSVYCADGERVHDDVGATYPHNNDTPSLMGTSTPHAAFGGNGFQDGTTNFYDSGSGQNAHRFDSANNVFTPGVVHHVEVYFAMNSFSGGADVADGIAKVWVDGNLVNNLVGLYLRTPGYEAQEFGRVAFTPNFPSTTTATQEMWMDNLVIADQPFGDGSGEEPPPPTVRNPMAMGGMNIF